MAEFDTSYRTPRHRSGMDPNTRKLALIAGGIGAALIVMVGAWSLTGGKSGGVPVVEADSRPLRVKPDKTQQGADADENAAPGKQTLAPTPEAPKPEALKAQADKAAAEKLAAEKLAADKLAAEKLAAERLSAEKLGTEKPAAEATLPVQHVLPSPAVVAQPAPAAVGKPPAQPVALSSPLPPAPAAAPSQSASPRSAAAPAAPARTATGTQVQLAALTSEQAAISEWSRLEKRMPDILGGRHPAVVKAERDGKTFWRLRTGGFADSGQASTFCEKVRAKGGTCSVASF